VISSRPRDTMMFGEVPICVISPPNSDAKDIGISNIDGETADTRAVCMATGIMIASAPIFLTKAESNTTMPTRVTSCVRDLGAPA
jgi:hypothetical protein